MKYLTTGKMGSKVIHSISLQKHSEQLVTFPRHLVDHILWMKKYDVDYARYAAKWYADLLPWIEIMTEIKKELKEQCE